ncbi:MAG TPA: DUF6569 family protein [Thermodesulfobacteriota bacterium]|jgi:hypothetical protein|nr:DUF6569 family protein [Thermodesulfobacteriota bacterium]
MSNGFRSWLNGLSYGGEKVHENLTIIPIVSSNGRGPLFLTLAKAIEDKLVEVREKEIVATVSEVVLINKSKEHVLIIDGDHLIGAKQNRVVNKTIIVPPRSQIVIPVSCTEQGRWHFVSENFIRGQYSAPSAIRRILKEKKEAQVEVWREVWERLDTLGVHSDTSSLAEAFCKIDPKVEESKKAFSPLPSQVGFMVFQYGGFKGLDILGNPSLFSQLYDGLIGGYVIDAVCSKDGKERKKAKALTRDGIIKHILEAEARPAEAIGVEERTSIMSDRVIGEYVGFQGKPVHLSVFPKEKRRRGRWFI